MKPESFISNYDKYLSNNDNKKRRTTDKMSDFDKMSKY